MKSNTFSVDSEGSEFWIDLDGRINHVYRPVHDTIYSFENIMKNYFKAKADYSPFNSFIIKVFDVNLISNSYTEVNIDTAERIFNNELRHLIIRFYPELII